jgi:hypothetical protein
MQFMGMWKNIVEPSRSQMAIRLLGITHWVPKATDTSSECVTTIAFPFQSLLFEGVIMLRYAHAASLVKIDFG